MDVSANVTGTKYPKKIGREARSINHTARSGGSGVVSAEMNIPAVEIRLYAEAGLGGIQIIVHSAGVNCDTQHDCEQGLTEKSVY